MTVHYDDDGWPACGAKSPDRLQGCLTAIPSKVTCKGCKRTKAYKYMMESD